MANKLARIPGLTGTSVATFDPSLRMRERLPAGFGPGTGVRDPAVPTGVEGAISEWKDKCNTLRSGRPNGSGVCCDMEALAPRAVLDEAAAAGCEPPCATPALIAAHECAAGHLYPSVLWNEIEGQESFTDVRHDHANGIRDLRTLRHVVTGLATGYPSPAPYSSVVQGTDRVFAITPPELDGVGVRIPILGVALQFSASSDDFPRGARITVTIGPHSRVPAAAADVAPVADEDGLAGAVSTPITRYFTGLMHRADARLILLFAAKRSNQDTSTTILGRHPLVWGNLTPFTVRVSGLSAVQDVQAELISNQATAMSDLILLLSEKRI